MGKSDLATLANASPFLMTTATNDNAFWPAPYTASHELGCFNGGIAKVDGAVVASFVQFSEAACTEDGDREPLVDDAGHDCPMKIREGGRPEFPVVLTALKLYAHLDGDKGSKCYSIMYANNTDSLRNN